MSGPYQSANMSTKCANGACGGNRVWRTHHGQAPNVRQLPEHASHGLVIHFLFQIELYYFHVLPCSERVVSFSSPCHSGVRKNFPLRLRITGVGRTRLPQRAPKRFHPFFIYPHIGCNLNAPPIHGITIGYAAESPTDTPNVAEVVTVRQQKYLHQ